jgi:hypothetical protein
LSSQQTSDVVLLVLELFCCKKDLCKYLLSLTGQQRLLQQNNALKIDTTFPSAEERRTCFSSQKLTKSATIIMKKYLQIMLLVLLAVSAVSGQQQQQQHLDDETVQWSNSEILGCI